MKNFICKLFSPLWDNPRNGVFLVLIFTVAVWTIQCSCLQSVLGLDVLEAISWGKNYDTWGNVKHPPLSGWIALAFTTLSGGKDWSLYLAAQLSLATGIWFTYLLGKMFLDKYSAAAGAVLLASCYYYCPSLLKFSTFFVETALAPVIAWSFFKAVREKKAVWYIVLGAVSAAGFLNKYSIGLLFIALAAVMFSTREYRRELRSIRPYLSAVIFILLISPHIHWLANNDFICLKHIGNRLDEEFRWYEPLIVAATAAYPFVLMYAVMTAAAFPLRKKLEKISINKPVFKWSLILSALPCALLLLNSLCGKSVIMLWFSTLASFCGILAVSLFPRKITRDLYRNILILIMVYMVGVFLATTIDLMVKSRPRLHMKPEDVIAEVNKVWQKENPGKPIPLVLGDRWFGNIIAHYHKDAPDFCEFDEELKDYWKTGKYIDKALANGAVVISRNHLLFMEFSSELEKRCGQSIDFHHNAIIPYKSLFGKQKARTLFIRVIRAHASEK